MSIDGYVAGPEGELDWMSPETDPLQLSVLKELTDDMDTIIMGRKMAEGFTSYWENVVNTQPDSPEYPYAKIFVETPKIVFSKTVKNVAGKNVTVENSDLVKSISKLYGGANFVSELIKENLIDELNLFVNPTAIGDGMKIFDGRFNFELVRSVSFSNGVVMNTYKQLDSN
jgi:dihydrofolate reductase